MGKDVTVLAVVGAQYGSEGKGVIVNHLAPQFDVHVRVGGPNAGHTFLYKGKEYKMRSIPCGWTNPNAVLVIGRGAIVNPATLKEELELIERVDPSIRDRLFVDSDAWCITPDDVSDEGAAEMQATIGSTLEGVGAARMRRIARSPRADHRFGLIAKGWGMEPYSHPETAILLNWYASAGRKVLLEGAQGFGLSLIHGQWPYVTSADTSASQLAADCGFGPRAITDVLLVIRTMPIRVGGNSGPLYGEMTWEQLSKGLGRSVREYTTVTKRLRRIGGWDETLIQEARIINGARYAALTFADYLDPLIEGQDSLTGHVKDFIQYLELRHSLDVCYVGTGGPNLTVIERSAPIW